MGALPGATGNSFSKEGNFPECLEWEEVRIVCSEEPAQSWALLVTSHSHEQQTCQPCRKCHQEMLTLSKRVGK